MVKKQKVSGKFFIVNQHIIAVFNRVALTRVLKEISYPIPATADRVPWLERLDVQTTECLPEDLDPLADVARENAL